jgi:hypothetical protein
MSDVFPFSRPRLSRAGLAVVCGLGLWIPVAQIPAAHGQADLTVTSGSLATASSGTFGSVSVSGTSPGGDRSTLTVTGPIAIDSGLTVSDRGLVVGQAAIDLGSGSGIVFDGGTLDLQSGTFSASGLYLSGTSSFARTGGAYAVSTLGLSDGAAVTVTADDRFVVPGEFSPASITLSSGATLTLQSNLVGSEGADVAVSLSGSTGGLVRTTQSYAVSNLSLDDGAALTFAAGDSVSSNVSITGGATLTLATNLDNPGLYLLLAGADSTLARTTQTVSASSLWVYDGATFTLAAGDVVDNIGVGGGATLTLPSTVDLPTLTLESLSLGGAALGGSGGSIEGLADRPYDLGYLALNGVGLTLRTGVIDDQIASNVILEAGGTLTLAKDLVLTGSQSGLTIYGSTSGLVRNGRVISVGSVYVGDGASFTIEAGDTVSEAIGAFSFDEAATLTLGRSVELAGENAEVYLSGAQASIQRGDPAYTITGTGAVIAVVDSASFEIAAGDSFTDAEVQVWDGGVLSNASSQSFATVSVFYGGRFQADAPVMITGTNEFSGAGLSVTDGGVFAAAADVNVTDAVVALGTLELLSGTFTADLLSISGSSGFDRDSGAAYAVGTLSLSSAATATFTNVDSIGELSLDSLAALTATVPLGLESLEITDGGLLTLEAFTGGGLDGYLWGLRLAGNQETSLAAWLASGAITTEAEWEILFDDSGEQTYTFVAVAVPEPGSVVLAGLGLIAAGWWRRRFRRRRGPLAAEPLEPRLALAADAWPTAAITVLPPGEGQPGDTIQWSVAFTEPVTGVDATDFRLVTSESVSIAQVGFAVAGSGADYTVTVTRIRGEGTLRLDLADDGSIRDSDGNPLRPTATTPTFSLQPEFSVGSGSPHPREGLKSVDLNGDGILDLVVSNTTSKTLSILLGSGTGSFRSGSPITVAGSLGAIEAADLDGDGRVDLVVASPDEDVVRVLLNRGNASFAAAVSYDVRDQPYSLRIADFDGDGSLDIAAATWGGVDSVSLLRGNGNGTFQPRQDLYPDRLLDSVLTGDFTGDGRPDVVVSDYSVSSLSLFAHAGSGSFLAPATVPIGAGLPSVMAAGDIDGDGNLDIAAVETGTAAISVLLGNGDGTFQPRRGVGVGFTAGTIALHDVTGDGRLDLVVTLPSLTQVAVLTGREDGTFGGLQRFTVGPGLGSLVVADFNRDGRPDIAVTTVSTTTTTTSSWGRRSTTETTTGAVRTLLNTAAGGITGAVASVAVTTPPAPLNLVVTRGDREVTLAWDAPPATGGAALTGYLVQRSEDGGTTWRSTPRTLADGRQLTVTGLSNGASYLFRVAAVNAVGTGAFTAASEAVKPVGYASEPQSVVGTAGDGVVNLSWDGPAEPGGDITDYVIEYRTVSGTGSGSWTVVTRPTSAATSAIVTGLVNGREYLFRVAAVNSLGQGAYGTTTTPTVPKTTPGMVTGLASVAGNGLIDVAWTALSAAATGGSPITGSVVEYKTVDAESWTRLPVVATPATALRVTGLVNGTPYLYRVAAMNAVGLGAFTEGPAAAVPFEPAAAPAIESVTPGSRELTLSWALPTSDGGSPITDYVVQYRLASPSIWTTLVRSPSPERSATVTGLANGNAYLFRVAAITAAGPGNWSPVSAPATPVGLPSSAGVVRTAPGDGSVRLFWMEAWNAGAPITNYTIDYSLDTSDPAGWVRIERPASTALSAEVSGLANGVSHVFRVMAVNAIGAGEPSYSAPTMPNILPGAPGSVAATAANRSATLTWTAPTANGGTAVTGYVIQYRAGELGQWVTFGRTTTAATSATVSGLINSLPHAFRVAAVNALGTGDYSEASAAVTPSAVAAPTVLGVAIRGTPAYGASEVSWDVTFSKPVTGVDASDFATVTGGLTTVGTRSVTGSGATYVVTASGITGAGTVGLNLVDNGSIRDAAGNRLAQAGTMSFQQTNVTMGLLPMSLAVADVNGDGRPDLITANDGNARVSVRLGLANGTYQVAANYAVGANPRGVVVADVNRDGRLDIVVVDRGGSTVTWLRGSGTGSFVAQPRLSAGSAPSAVVVADVNLDGLPDFVVANPLAGTVSILAQTSSGGFQSRRSVSVPGTPNSLAVADVNLDGRPDIVTADSNGSTVAVLLGNGNLTFQPPQLFAANTRPDGLTLADLDGDGLLDIVVVNKESGTVSVLAGTGSGTFRAPVTYAVGANPSAVAVADVDGDTRPDLVVTNAFSGAASVLLADGSGGFQERRSLASGGFPVAAAAADFNGDGRTDLAVVDAFLPGVKLFTNGLNGTTTGGVAALSPLPGAPSLTTAAGGNARATLSWTTGDNGGVPITNYVIDRRSDGGEWTPVTRPVSAATTATVTGLTNGTTYEFRVAAVTAIGRGEFSGVLSVTPAPVAPGEVIPDSTVAGNGQATVSWLAPLDDGGAPVSDYVVQYRTVSGDWTTLVREPSTVRSAVVTGLTNGTTYVFRFAAVNVAGTGEFSTAVMATPYTLSDGLSSAPAATSGNTSATLTWEAPLFDGGAPITNYLIESSTDGGASWTPVVRPASAQTSALVAGLVNGTSYRFRVAPVNLAGAGPFTETTTAVVPAPVAPGAPTTLVVTAAEERATASWAAPVTDGGSVITGYTIQYSTDGGATWTVASSVSAAVRTSTVTGLAGGRSHIFRVAAVNAIGTGQFATAAPVTPVSDAHPRVTAISLAAPVGPGATSVTWNVTFSEPVTGVDAADFQLAKVGSANTSSALVVNGSGAAYTITATSVTGTGTLGLNLVDNDSVRDASGKRLMARGVPTFQAKQPAAMQGEFTLGDFDGDGRIDSVVNRSAQLHFLRGNGDGTFQSPVAVVNLFNAGRTTMFGVMSLTAGDVNGDGKLDLVFAQYEAYDASGYSIGGRSVIILPGNGNGTFGAAQSVTVGYYPVDVLLTDLNGDARLDLVVANGGGDDPWWARPGDESIDTVSVRLNNGSGGFLAETKLLLPPGIFDDGLWGGGTGQFASGDFNRDGHVDLLVGRHLFKSDGNGSFHPRETVAGGGTVGAITAGDVDGDGWLDILHQDRADGFVRLNLGSAHGFGEATYLGYDWFLRGLRLVDLDGDGLRDLVGLHQGVGVVVRHSLGNGAFAAPQQWATTLSPVQLVDINGDGRLDVVGVDYYENATQLNGAVGTFIGERAILTTAPGAPQSLTVARGDASASLAWTVPAVGGSSAITSYTIEHSTNGGTTWTASTVTRTSPTATIATVTGLTNGVAYVFRVAAVNAAGTGAFTSASNPVMVATVPSRPTFKSWTVGGPSSQGAPPVVAGAASALVIWQHPRVMGGKTGGLLITDYEIQYSSDDGMTWQTWSHDPSSLTSATVTGLQNGTTYVFRVAAINAVGQSEYSATSMAVTPVTTPDVPAGVSALASTQRAVVSWSAPGWDGGSAITRYQLQRSSDAGATWVPAASLPSTATTWTDINLIAGASYRYRVSAVNAVGGSSFGESNAVVPGTYPVVTGIELVGAASTSATAVAWTVTFSESVTGVDATDFVIVGDGVVATTLHVTGSGATYTVTAVGLSGAGTIGLNLGDDGTIRDLAGAGLRFPGGSVSFESPLTYATGTGPHSLTVQDINGDGMRDLIIANTTSKTIGIMLGNGNGTFQPQTSYSLGIHTPTSLVLADVNGDGNWDIVAGTHSSYYVAVFLGAGDGSFKINLFYTALYIEPRHIVVSDVTGDGFSDVLFWSSSHTLFIMQGKGNGDFEPYRVLRSFGGASISSVVVADVNADGKADLVVTRGIGGSGLLSIMLGSGGGAFQPTIDMAVNGRLTSLAVGDFDADGKLDLVTNGRSSDVLVLLGNGQGTFQTAQSVAAGDSTTVAVADVNADGRLDIVVANGSGNSVSVLIGRGDGTFLATQTVSIETSPSSSVVDDVDGDGLYDLIVLSNSANTTGVLRGRRIGVFTGQVATRTNP